MVNAAMDNIESGLSVRNPWTGARSETIRPGRTMGQWKVPRCPNGTGPTVLDDLVTFSVHIFASCEPGVLAGNLECEHTYSVKEQGTKFRYALITITTIQYH